MPDPPHRLPRDVEPVRYRLCFEPDLKAATFTGTAEIDLVVHRPCTQVVCNAAELRIDRAVLRPAGGGAVEAEIELDAEAERAAFVLPEPLPGGPATLQLDFAGVLNDQLRGFYLSTFTDDAGATHRLATTQMEAVDARRAFPCWDEPDRKAVFDITLVAPDGLAAYSNGSVAEESDLGSGRRRVRFSPTMKMSPYLVAMIVGPLEATDPVDVDGVPLRVVHPPGRGELCAFALEIGAFALRFFADYFAIPYPADKLDLVAIPDFAMGAMENLGCVTFRETALLVDPERASRHELERVADVVAHEIAHMWFGDLVTMGWWEGIWLNEAFATFMEILCCDAFRPAWHRWVSFGLEREMALAVDGLHTTRPIEFAVGSPSEIDAMFDVLTYQKGGSVLRMLEQYLGPEVFRDGVRLYLDRHRYANTVTSDLWSAIESVSGEPVRAVMDTWILQGGHPLVAVEGGDVVQRPFSYRPEPAPGVTAPAPGAGHDGRVGPASAIGRTWQVPVGLRRVGGTGGARLLLGTDRAPVASATGTLDGDGPLIANAGGWGVYRTAYAPEHLAELGRCLGALEPLEKAGLFADTWALVLAGQVAVDGFLRLAARLGDEAEPSIWATLCGALGLCWRAARAADAADGARADGAGPNRLAAEAATRRLLGPRLDALGWDPRSGDDERTPGLRAMLVATLGTIGADPNVRAEAARRFDADEAGETPLDPDLASAVLEVVADQNRPGDYDRILERYRRPATPQEELRHLSALGAFPDTDLALRTVALALGEVRTQNAPFLLGGMLANRYTGTDVWLEVQHNWATLLDRFPPSSHPRMVASVRALCEDADAADGVRQFLLDHPVPAGQRQVLQSLERLQVNRDFVARERAGIAAALAARGEAS